MSRNRLDESWTIGRIAKRLAQLADRGIETVVEDDESVRRPQMLPQLLAGDDRPGSLQKQHERFERLVLQMNATTALPELVSPQVEFKHTKTNDLIDRAVGGHGVSGGEV